jgi:prepilin-type N-terminal cleavage/methylation domain-containing protein
MTMRDKRITPTNQRLEHPAAARRALTLLEMLVVSLIIAILTTIAVVTVTGLTTRARIAATAGTIRAMEIAADRYEIDLGEFPFSSTGFSFPGVGSPAPGTVAAASPGVGNGYFLLSVLHSLSANASTPLDDRWSGPLLDVEIRQIGDLEELNASWGSLASFPVLSGTSTAATQQLLDAFGNPFRYVRSGPGTGSTEDYDFYGGTQFPSGSPFALTETYFNYGRFQIVSMGPDGTTVDDPFMTGLDDDDITNLGNAGLP